MFTGIIESQGLVDDIREEGTNRVFWIRSDLAPKLKVDQSIAHDGVCLTIEKIKKTRYQVTAIRETLDKTTLGDWVTGRKVNLERGLKLGERLDGHLVQGHVDSTGTCKARLEREGSWEFRFNFPEHFGGWVIEKGSITINGISLSAFNVSPNSVDVAIIPYTFENTNISTVLPGMNVNIEFDMMGKYIHRQLSLKKEFPK